jgi:hypothetical protein
VFLPQHSASFITQYQVIIRDVDPAIDDNTV